MTINHPGSEITKRYSANVKLSLIPEQIAKCNSRQYFILYKMQKRYTLASRKQDEAILLEMIDVFFPYRKRVHFGGVL